MFLDRCHCLQGKPVLKVVRMAKVYSPRSYDEAYSEAERTLLEAAEVQLDNSYHVLHSLSWRGMEKTWQQGECDFVILHQKLGLVTIEAKPGTISHDSDGWKDSRGKSAKDPVQQAQQGMHNVQNFLSNHVPGWSHQTVPHSFAIYLCRASEFRGRLPISLRPEQLIFESDLEDLAATLDRIKCVQVSREVCLSREMIEQAVNALMPPLQFVQSFSGHLETERRKLIRLTGQQSRILRIAETHDRMLIQGCAGCGKTLLAIERAVMFAKSGKRVLLLCYNLRLQQMLQQHVSRYNLPGIDVFAFAELCEHLARTTGLSVDVPHDESLRSEYYNVKCIEYLEQAIDRGAKGMYEAIVVDEGQDFQSEWWVLIEDLLPNPGVSPLYIFYDPDQNIFRRDFQFPITNPFLLRENCRSTRSISEFIRRTVGREEVSMDGVPDGDQVLTWRPQDDQGVVDRAADIVRRLVHGDKIQPSQICVVGLRKLRNSAFANCANLAGVPFVGEEEHDGDSQAIQYATIWRYKGLESDIVILTGFEEQFTSEMRKLFYTAASRAVLRLYVIYSQPSSRLPASVSPQLDSATVG